MNLFEAWELVDQLDDKSVQDSSACICSNIKNNKQNVSFLKFNLPQ